MLIGQSQTFSISNLSVTLIYDDFDGNFASGVGYKRTRQQLPEIDYNIMSTPVIRSPSFSTYIFEWSLVLRDEKAYQLEALVDECWRITQEGGEPGVRLLDERLPLVESQRRRAMVGGLITPTMYWPQWNIIFTEFTPEWLMDKYTKVSLKAVELGTVPI